MITFWNSLSPEMQTAVAGAFAGIVLYLFQRIWTNSPVLAWLGPDDSTRKKRLVAILLAGVAGIVGGQGDLQQTVIAFIAALGASQTTFLWTKPGGPTI